MLIEKVQDLLSLTKRKIVIIIIVWLVCIILHDIISALLRFDEALFFILGVFVVPTYFLASVLYSVIIYIRFRKQGKSEKIRTTKAFKTIRKK